MENTFIGKEALAILAWTGIIVGVDYFAILAAVMVDLRAGTLKARARGERTTSRGYRRSVDKAGRYIITLLACTLIDLILVLSAIFLRSSMNFSVPAFPLFTTLGAVAMCLIEMKSVMESAQSKRDYRELVRNLNDLLNDKDLRTLIDSFRASAQQSTQSADVSSKVRVQPSAQARTDASACGDEEA